MSSTSQSGVSTITVYLRLNYDADKALTEINTKIASVLNQLPSGTQQPVLTVKVGQTIDAMYMGFDSDVLPRNKITDYLVRVVQPKLQAIPGVQTAEVLGGQNFALRAWLDPAKLAAYGLTATDVTTALQKNDYISGLGATKGQMVQVSLTASTSLHSAKEFANLVIKQANGAIVRLQDVANVSLGADDYESQVSFDGKQAVYIGVQVAPEKFIAAIEEHKPDIVGFSAFLTTTMPMFKANINALQKSGLRDQVIVMVGGAPVTQEYADAVGADGYSADASSAVKKAKELIQLKRDRVAA